MNDAKLSLNFQFPTADTFDTLEAVLAIARRGGLHLRAMRVSAPSVHRMSAFLQLEAHEGDLLDLFIARLQNLFCVEDVQVHADRTSDALIAAPDHAALFTLP